MVCAGYDLLTMHFASPRGAFTDADRPLSVLEKVFFKVRGIVSE